MQQSPLDRLKVDEWDNMIDINIKGVLYAIAAALPHMQRQKRGTSSMSRRLPATR
jgi:NADP-dependent 3-hydroxy acid dehydrogenase YdfG